MRTKDYFDKQQKNEIQTEETKKRKLSENWLVLYIEVFAMILLGQLAGGAVVGFLSGMLSAFIPELTKSAAWATGTMYFGFIGIWLAALLIIWLSKKDRPMLKSFGTGARGNNWINLLIGISTGFLLNGFCIFAAWLHKDISLRFDAIKPVSLVIIFVMVFVQSSAEELICRGFLYQKLMKSYKKPVIAIAGNSLLFAVLHLGNEGVSVLSLLNIFLVGILCSLMVYYMDSLWCAFAMHAAWNFTQNIIFGLPNSGIIVPYSVFKLDASTARDSFAYNVGFGIEGTLMADILLLIVCIVFYLWGKRSAKNGK